MNAPALRRPLAARLRAAWDELAPGFTYSYDNGGLERWDGKGAGPGRCLGFEGFGLQFTLFFGRVPPNQDGAA